MALTLTPVDLRPGHYLLSGTLTAQGTSTETDAVTGCPKVGRIVRADFKLTSGSGATLDPHIRTATGVTSGPGLALEVTDTPAAAPSFYDGQGVPFYAADEQLFVAPRPNTGSDNAVSVEVLIVEGWR